MNLTIFVFYSPDRRQQLEQMVRLNSRMTGWGDAEKLLLVDGRPNCRPEGFAVIEVPRPTDDFNWSRMWGTGVAEASRDNVLYLDSDRVLPTDYLEQVVARLGEDRFLFADSLFGFSAPATDDEVAAIVDNYTADDLRAGIDRVNQELGPARLVYDPRYRLPLHGPGKGAMSGNTAFARATYARSGGVDPWYSGHGAWADSDFHKQVWEAGFEVVALDALELHLWHPKRDAEDVELSGHDVEVLSLRNFIYHARKWDLGYAYPEAIARHLGLGDEFVRDTLRGWEIDIRASKQ